jgi:hypothetical protein
VFDFEHTGSGIYNDRFKEVTLQTAFQYSTVVTASTSSSSGSGTGGSSNLQQQQQQQQVVGDGQAQRYVVQRRLRVCTVR